MRRSPSKSELKVDRLERQKRLLKELADIEKEQEERIKSLQQRRALRDNRTATTEKDPSLREQFLLEQKNELRRREREEHERKEEALKRIEEAEKAAALKKEEEERLHQDQIQQRERKESQSKSAEQLHRESEMKKKKEEIMRLKQEKQRKEQEQKAKIEEEERLKLKKKSDAELKIKQEKEQINIRLSRRVQNKAKKPPIIPPIYSQDPSRPIKTVEEPTQLIMEYHQLEISDYDFDYENLRLHFLRQGRLSKDCILNILTKVESILKTEPNVLELEAPITVVGDIHGQYYDLNNLFQISGQPETKKYLFLGDYVDRGFFSLETIIYLFAIKIAIPNAIYLLRGNHETRETTRIYSFIQEVLVKFDQEVYDRFMEVFDALPLAAVISNDQGKWFCCHGGLTEQLSRIQDLQDVDRFCEPAYNTLVMEMLWSDPMPESSELQRFKQNKDRGSGNLFGYHAITSFLKENKLVCIVRAHEVKRDGYDEHWYRKWHDGSLPLCITLFSAPNYCDTHANSGAFMNLKKNSYSIHQFPWVSHPYVLPQFQNCFTFTLPFVLQNLVHFLIKTMEVLESVEAEEEESSEANTDLVPLRQRMREANVKMLSLKQTSSRNIEDLGTNLVVGEGKSWFDVIKDMDKDNEKLVRDSH